uniref:RCE1 homolog, prenyl protein peptidasea n=1 Tax=Nothobranchius kadleci TaxID=1051664 RepID=A0A1A8DYG4_NOTKA
MVLFLGPLMQLAIDCPWTFIDGIRMSPTKSSHFHHVIELLRFRQGTMSGIFISAVFQFSYTAVFGAYTAFIFIRTGPTSPNGVTPTSPTEEAAVCRSLVTACQNQDLQRAFTLNGSFQMLLDTYQ